MKVVCAIEECLDAVKIVLCQVVDKWVIVTLAATDVDAKKDTAHVTGQHITISQSFQHEVSHVYE